MKTALVLLIIGHGVGASLPAQGADTIGWARRDSAVATRVAGCYELVEGDWRSDSDMAKIDSIPNDPIRFELTRNPAGWSTLSEYEHTVYFEVRTDSIAQWGRGLFTTWIRLSETTIHVSRPLPMAGFALNLTPRGVDLVGTITAFTDAIPPDGKYKASHAVTARRITCPVSRSVSIYNADHGLVAADVYGSGDRGVVLAHGGRFDRTSWREQAQQIAAAGFRVVAIDFHAAVEARAGRETPCLYDESCLAKDVVAGMRYLRGTGVKNISLVGASLGGGAVAQASADAAVGDIDRIVLLAHMPIQSPEKIKGRKLFIVARHDTGSGNVPRLPEIQAQYAKAADPKKLVILDGSAHAQFLFQTSESKRLMDEILRFLTAP